MPVMVVIGKGFHVFQAGGGPCARRLGRERRSRASLVAAKCHGVGGGNLQQLRAAGATAQRRAVRVGGDNSVNVNLSAVARRHCRQQPNNHKSSRHRRLGDSTMTRSFFGVGAPEALVVGVVALLVFGPKGLAEAARSLGEALRAFQPTIKELQEVSQEFKSTLEQEIGVEELKRDIDSVRYGTPPPPPTTTPTTTETAETTTAAEDTSTAQAAATSSSSEESDEDIEAMRKMSADMAWGRVPDTLDQPEGEGGDATPPDASTSPSNTPPETAEEGDDDDDDDDDK
ncbi:Sec-independent protein translocase protein TATB [Pycnococcus provasolii]